MQIGDSRDEVQLFKQPPTNRIQDSFDPFHWRLNRYGRTEIPGLLDDGDSLVVYAKNRIIGEGRESSKLLSGVPGESLVRDVCVP